MSEIRVNNLSNESDSGGPTISGITTFSSPYFFIPPVGSTAERPDNPQKGELRFNTDSKHLEYFKGDTIGWAEVEASNDELNGGARGVFMGGFGEPASYDTIEYVTISTLGNVTDFGNLLAAEGEGNAFSSSTRGFYFGGDPADNEIERITFASTGNAVDAGDLTATSKTGIGLANATRGIAYLNNGDTINYYTMASSGNAVDFGNASFSGGANGMGYASSTRGVYGGVWTGATSNVLDYITIATTGNAADFGDLTVAQHGASGASNATRGVCMGGYTYPSPDASTNVINYVTIATLGNAVDFGDCTANHYTAGSSSSTRMISGGGGTPFTNAIQYVEIMTTGNAQDFGDLSTTKRHLECCSNGHGGL